MNVSRVGWGAIPGDGHVGRQEIVLDRDWLSYPGAPSLKPQLKGQSRFRIRPSKGPQMASTPDIC